MNQVAVICVVALGVLLFGLGPIISTLRGKSATLIGCETDPTNLLYKFVRAHANTAEYVPFLAVLMLYLGSRHPAGWVVWTMVAVTLFRYIYVLGMIAPATMAKPNPMRFTGAAGTYFAGLALCWALLMT